MNGVETDRRPSDAAPTSGILGQAVRRREDHRLLTGDGRFLDDLDFGPCYEAAILRSPYPAADINGIDCSAARKAKGVVEVFTAAELAPILAEIPPKVTHPELKPAPRYAIAVDRVRYVGEAVAVVVAETRRLAEDAMDLIEVDYAPRASVGSTAQALLSDAPLVHEAAGTNVAVRIVQTAGDPEAALRDAPHRVSETFHIARGGGHSMEGRAVAARFDAASALLTIWDATQTPHYIRTMLCSLYGMTEEQIRVIAPADIGGGFGPKAQFYGEEALIPWIAMQVGAPVKWVEDRWENFVSATMERTQTHRVEVGFDDFGHLLALKDVFEHDQGAYCIGLQVPSITLSTVPGPYKIPNIHSEVLACYTNMVPTSSLRGAGRPQAVAAMERIMDRIGEYLGLEADEVRRRNLVGADEFPYAVGLLFRDGSPLTYDSGNYPALLDEAAHRIGISEFRTRQTAARRQGRFLGLGIAMFVEGSGLGPYEGGRVRLTNAGRIIVTLGASAQGQGYETVYAQVAADALGVDISLIDVRYGDTAGIPFGQGTFASRVTATAGPAVCQACERLRSDLLAAGASLLRVGVDEVEMTGGGVGVNGSGQAVPLREIAAAANVGRHGITVPADLPVALEHTVYFKPIRAVYSSGIHAVVVDVDVETGQVAIVQSVVGHDCGRVLNPLLVEGQVYGAYAHGIGNALYEEAVYSSEGEPLAASYLDYALPTSMEVVRPELFHVESPSPLNPLGVKGAGEGGLIPVPGAVANAVEDALRPFGARINQLPVTPSRVLQAIWGDDDPDRLA